MTVGASNAFPPAATTRTARVEHGRSVVALVVFTVGVGALVIVGLSPAGCPRSDPACDYDTTAVSLSGVYLGQIAVVVLAVLAVTPEYDTGMIRTTLAAHPRRTSVFAAKAAPVLAIVLGAAAVTVLGSLVVGRIILPGNGFTTVEGYPPLSLADGPTLRAYGGTVLYFGLIAVLSLGVGFAVRHTAGTITVVLSLLYTLPIVATVVSDEVWRERILRFSPMTAGLAIQATKDLDALPIKPWPGIGVLAAYAAAALFAGTLLFKVRDA